MKSSVKNLDLKNLHPPKLKLKKQKVKRRFEETRLGFYIKYNAPVEYELIISITPNKKNPEPKTNVIEAIAAASNNPVLQSQKFFTYLDDYKKDKLYSDKVMKITEYGEELFKKRMQNQAMECFKKMKKRGYKPY